jgi:hypothetical protein
MKAPVGEAFGAQPKALAIVGQEFERRAGAVAKDGDRAAQGIVAQGLATQCGEPIYALAAVDGLHREKNAAVRGELEHQRDSRNVCSKGTSAGEAS